MLLGRWAPIVLTFVFSLPSLPPLRRPTQAFDLHAYDFSCPLLATNPPVSHYPRPQMLPSFHSQTSVYLMGSDQQEPELSHICLLEGSLSG